MSDPSTRFRDRSLFALVLVPVVALVAFVACAAASWKTEAAKIRPMLLDSFPATLVDAPSPVAVAYDERTSTDKTAAFRELGYAAHVLSDKYRVLFEILGQHLNRQEDQIESPEEGHGVYKYVDDYLAEAQPLLKRIQELQPDSETIWLPLEFGNPQYWSSDSNLYANLLQLLMTEFRSAVRGKETDRAVRAIKLLHGIEAPINDIRRPDRLLAESMGTSIWSEAELDQFVELLGDERDLDELWKQSMRHRQLYLKPWLLHDRDVPGHNREPVPVSVAPSRRVEWLRRHQDYANVGGVGSVGMVKKVGQVFGKSKEASDAKMDVALQYPNYGRFASLDGEGSETSLAVAYTGIANERRVARTAVAIASYKVKFGEYPRALGELTKVGLPASETLDPNGQPFQYVIDDQDCRLGNAATPFPRGRGYRFESFQSPVETLSAVLQYYQEIEFR
jgi:hypothetical protein